MALWKDSTPPRREPGVAPVAEEPRREVERAPEPEPARVRDLKESVLGSGLSIEGKIQGSGHVRIAGRFNGDVHVDGDLTIERGAKVVGSIRAATVTIGGELEGNVESAVRVDLLTSGVLNGNLTAGSLTVAAGSRMRGQVTFGWEERPAPARPEVVRETLGVA